MEPDKCKCDSCDDTFFSDKPWKWMMENRYGKYVLLCYSCATEEENYIFVHTEPIKSPTGFFKQKYNS